MEKKLKRVRELLGEISDINSAIFILEWDQQTYMPKLGAGERAKQISTLSGIAHEKFISEELGSLLSELKAEYENLPEDSDDFCLIKVADREYKRKTKLPTKLVAEFSHATAVGQHNWEEARSKNDFKLFEKSLTRIFDLRRKMADFQRPWDCVYDPLLDEFEPGMKIADVLKIFEEVKPVQIELVKSVAGMSDAIHDSFLYEEYDPQKQWDFGLQILSDMGYDWDRGRQDKAVHPFTTTFGLGDVRITTRIIRENFMSGLFSSIHECGHALYEQGIARNLSRTPLGTGTSLALHESQSRFWENIVGRSMAFWSHYYPKLQTYFPNQLAKVSLEDFYRAINKVKPSLVRVEADEVTYNLHVMLRLELELAVLNNEIKVAELPGLWKEKMNDYLGVVPETDADGVLQDVHWSCGIIGYFPTYALGNMISAMVWQKADSDLENLSGQIAAGKLKPLREYLRKKIHIHGAKFEPAELLRKVFSKGIDPKPYLDYLQNKVDSVYLERSCK